MRESPHAKLSPGKPIEQWPPRSPLQVLLSSPSGRRKWQERGRREGSPSPVKVQGNAGRTAQAMSVDSEDDADIEEDEEMLQLKLQAIQAKLKLKKLQKAKKEGLSDGSSVRISSRAGSSLPTSPRKTQHSSAQRVYKPAESDVEVPLSPTKEREPPKEPVSPARRRLGLNAPAKAQEVSLKRARDGTQIKRSDTSRLDSYCTEQPKATSFSERLNRSRADAQGRQAKAERIENVRSTGFGATTSSTFSEVLQSTGLNGRSTPASDSAFTRPASAHQMHASTKLDREGSVARSASTRAPRPGKASKPRVDGLFASLAQDQQSSLDASQSRNSAAATDPSSPGYDTFSQLHLSKRHIPHVDVARAMADKEIYNLPRLLKEVKAPHYDPPDCENDFVVFGILASKSSPFDQKAAHRTSDENKAQEDAFDTPRNKFMVFRLTDLKWEVDCFLFGSAFDQFWKLTPGTLLAILNPGIMAPKGNQNTGQFSLKLGSSEDCVMEIGVARDLGYCTAVKKDGNLCGTWVDKTSTEICEFHLNLEIDRNRKHRMEVNSMWRGHKKGELNDKLKSRNGAAGAFDRAMGKDKKPNSFHHPEFGQIYTVPNGGGRSAANLLDAEDMAHSAEQQEASRKRIAAAQRERDLAKKLGQMGSSVGAEYMKIKTASYKTTSALTNTEASISSSAEAREELFAKPSVAELGLLANKATEQHLSPAKDRKRHFGLGALSSAGADAMGWSGAKKPGLLLPKDKPRDQSPEKGQTRLDTPAQKSSLVRGRSEDGSLNTSPKKRARFMLEKKGLRGTWAGERWG